jgi:hypothetical protein
MRARKIHHRKYICKLRDPKYPNYYKHDGQYAKGKIHCSCPMCTYEKYYDKKRLSEIKADDEMRAELKDLEDTEFNKGDASKNI